MNPTKPTPAETSNEGSNGSSSGPSPAFTTIPSVIMKWVGAVASLLGLVVLVFTMVWGAITFVENRTQRKTDEQFKELSAQISSLEKNISLVRDDTAYLRNRLDAHVDEKSKK